MLSVDECKEILNENTRKYTDEEIEKIRCFLYQLAEIVDGFNEEKKS